MLGSRESDNNVTWTLARGPTQLLSDEPVSLVVVPGTGAAAKAILSKPSPVLQRQLKP
jgi:hypothetical protein